MVLIGRVRVDGVARWVEAHDDALVELDRAPWQGGRPTGARHPRDGAEWLAPVTPSKIVCVGLNYREHIAESLSVAAGMAPPADPLLFLKPPSAVIGPGEAIRYPAGVTRLDPEAELAIVIGRRARHADLDEAASCVAGITCFNDVSARNFQRSDGQWTRAKGFDTFAPIGPVVALGLEAAGRTVECLVNGVRRQFGNTSDLIVPVPELVRHVSRIMSLEPGDVIATGTPAGIAPVAVGDQVTVRIDGVGSLENPVREEFD